MQAIWFGHSAVRIKTGDAVILIDPFLNGNESFTGDVNHASEACTHVLLTHGHDDHIGDTVEICKQTGAQLVANFEICMYLSSKGIENINPGYHGGEIDCGAFSVAFTPAMHGSSTLSEGGAPIYLGSPCGLVIKPKTEGDPVVLHMGDTGIFSDMKLIHEFYAPKVGFVPVGDRFTMGGEMAARACRDYFDFRTVIPVHYGTFPIIDPDPSKFEAAMQGSGVEILVPAIGTPFDL